MFGFSGHWEGIIDIEQQGEVVSKRYFHMKSGVKRASFTKSMLILFDIDNANATKADNQFLTSSIESAYDASNNKADLAGPVYAGFSNSIYTSLFKFYADDNSHARGFSFNSTSALTPVTYRKIRYKSIRPDWMENIAISPATNNSAIFSSANLGTNSMTFNLEQFPNLRSLFLDEVYFSSLTIRFAKRIENVVLFELMNPALTSISGKLPVSCKYFCLGQSFITSINTFISEATALEAVILGRMATHSVIVNVLTTLTGTLDVSMLPQLKEFLILANTSLSAVTLPSGKSDWVYFHFSLMTTAGGALSTSRLDEVIGSSTLKVFIFTSNAKSWTRAISDSDIASNLAAWHTHGNSISGNISITTAKANLKEFLTGNSSLRTGIQQNSHPTVNIFGLTGATIIDLTGSNISELQLPVNTVCTNLYLYDNLLSRYYLKHTSGVTSGWVVGVGAATISYGSDSDGNYVELETSSTLPTMIGGPSGINAAAGRYYRITWKYKPITNPYGCFLTSDSQGLSEIPVSVPSTDTVNTLYTKSKVYVATTNGVLSPTVVFHTYSGSTAGDKIRIYEVKFEEDLLSQINAMTGVTDLRLGSGSFTLGTSGTGQSSTNGLDANPDLSGLVNCTNLFLNACKITGTLTLPNIDKLVTLDVAGNTGLTAIANLSAHTSLGQIGLNNTTISIALGTGFTNLTTIDAMDAEGLTSVDMTGKTTGNWNRINIQSCGALTQVKLTADFSRSFYFYGSSFIITNNPLLTSFVNLEYLNWSPQIYVFSCWLHSNALNMTFPIGLNNFIPSDFRIDNNGMSQANVNATINNLYTNRTKWNVVSGSKIMNIGGTNAAASGTYQAPSGFVLGSNDGTPANAKEQLYVLVNNYGWSMTYN